MNMDITPWGTVRLGPPWGNGPYRSGVITAVHTLIYSDDAPATRAFLHDVLGWPCVEDVSSEPGWLIFQTGPSEMGVHPSSAVYEGQTYEYGRHHQISLMCDDIEATRAELSARGATVLGDVREQAWGLATMMELPGCDPIGLYQPKHPTAFDL
jgi:predicted enzyme related to lactoylglutathione lyase